MRVGSFVRVWIAVTFATAMNACASSDATAPTIAPPSPGDVLAEARADRNAGRFAAALEKHLWFHEHALEMDQAYRGVRLSFALVDWYELGRLYPPAMRALEATASGAESAIRGGSAGADRFRDLSAINGLLGQSAATAELFAWLDGANAEYAAAVYPFAEADLVRAGMYSATGPYLQPARETERLIAGLRAGLQMAGNPALGRGLEEYAHRSFINSSATLVALLVLNGRAEEADVAMVALQGALQNTDLEAALTSARLGVVPEPWPPQLAPRRTAAR